MDAARAVTRLIDTNGDGSHSKDETNEWSRLFVAEQNVTVNGQPLSLKLDAMRTNLPAEMSDGHATIAVNFTAIPSEPWHGAQTIVCTNHYQPIHSVYQSNGLIPKDPSVHILSHRRDAAQQALTLNAEFLDSFPETVSNKSKQPRPADPSSWLLGTGLTGAVLAALYRHRSKPA